MMEKEESNIKEINEDNKEPQDNVIEQKIEDNKQEEKIEPQDNVIEQKIENNKQEEKIDPQDNVIEQKTENNKQEKKIEPQDNVIEQKIEKNKQEKKIEPQKKILQKIIKKNSKEDNEKNETKSFATSLEQETNINLTLPTCSNISELSKSVDANKPNQQQKQKLGLMSRTKSWMGNIWQSMKKVNVKKFWHKAEYIEYKTANGDIIKIPKKKLNLKKKKNINNKSKQIPQNIGEGNYYGIHYNF